MTQRLALDYLRGSVVNYPPGAAFGPRQTRDFELVWIVDGQCVYHINGADHAAPPGTMVLSPPGCTDGFTWDPHRRTRHAFFHFQPRCLPEDWPAVELWPVARTLPEHDIIRPLFRYILASLGNRETEPTPMACRAVETLLGAFVTGQMTQAEERDREYPLAIERAMAYLRQHVQTDPAAPLSLGELASAAKVSEGYLCRQFRQTLDVGPMEALRLLRLDLAVNLLTRSNLSIAEIAYRCGFSSPDHFAHRFKETYDRTPGHVRKGVERRESPPISKLVRHWTS